MSSIRMMKVLVTTLGIACALSTNAHANHSAAQFSPPNSADVLLASADSVEATRDEAQSATAHRPSIVVASATQNAAFLIGSSPTQAAGFASKENAPGGWSLVLIGLFLIGAIAGRRVRTMTD
jgi:hypothetical protein